MNFLGRIAVIALVAAACSPAATPDAANGTSESPASTAVAESSAATSDPSSAPSDTVVTTETIRVPLSLYVVTDAGDPDSDLSSTRTTEELSTIALRVGEIWRSSGIEFDPVHVGIVAVPTEVLASIDWSLDTQPFFDEIGLSFDVTNPGVVNGFYVATAGGVNGFAPRGSRVFFVVDEPTVHDERVSSHEIGHLFGLHHDLGDAGQLMFSGTNGTTLNERERVVARYGAQGLPDDLR